ncbi:hypothetical protein KKF11_03480, partial [Patescibacteria group bacterium]|nr:hypothetical protein [Patescibacteria group bacterium]
MENEAITGIGEIEPGLTLILQVPDGKNLLVVALGRPIAITGANRHLIPVSPMEKRRENGEVEEINLRRILWLDSSSWIGGNYQMIKGPSWDLKDLIAEARFI